MDAYDTNHPSLYFNRELSLLKFQWRVLEQAKDPDTPLLERLRFLSSNDILSILSPAGGG